VSWRCIGLTSLYSYSYLYIDNLESQRASAVFDVLRLRKAERRTAAMRRACSVSVTNGCEIVTQINAKNCRQVRLDPVINKVTICHYARAPRRAQVNYYPINNTST